MKLNFEKTKSILLFLLVLLSLMLTWGLWTFQPQYDFKKIANHNEVVTIGEKRQFNEVVKPTQFIYHHDSNHYGITNDALSNELYRMVMDLNVLEYEHIQFSSKDQFQSFLSQSGNLEMIFPVSLPIHITNYIMRPIRQEWDLEYFDRIIVNFTKERAIYYVSSTLDQAIKLNIEDEQLDKIIKNIEVENKSKLYYFTITAGNGHTLYLPENRVLLNQLTFSTQNIPLVDFKNILFNNVSGVKQYSLNNGEESFTDGTSALEASQNKNLMRFINPANQELYTMDSAEMILRSIEFINDHSGWTDSYSVMNWNKEKGTIAFQLFVKGYPVFNPIGLTTIYQSWRDDEIYEYERPLINLRFSIDSEQKRVTLPSGRELLSYLTQIKPNFNLELLDNALVGYDFVRDHINPNVATVHPKWFIKYDGKWEEIHIPVAKNGQGGNDFGLE